MIKKSIPAVLFLIQIFVLQESYGQTPMNVTDYLSQKFLNYTTSVPREEIYIHSDRDDYISGENMWFNLYLIDRKSFKPSSDSKIAYFELLNQENRPVIQKKLLLEGGFGPGQITLPDTLSTGTYTIRAYTSWMKNFLPDNCFIKEIHIYNAFSSKTIKRKSFNTRIPDLSQSFNKNPSISGLALIADNLKPDVLKLLVLTDEKYRTENNNLFYLFIQTHGIMDRASSERINEDTTKIYIPKKQLRTGINQINIFDSRGQPVAERFIYTAERVKLNVSLRSADSIGLRKKITLEVEVGGESGSLINSANLSISVAHGTNNNSDWDLNDYLVFGTEYGFLPWQSFPDKRLNEIRPEAIDSLLKGVRSNWIDWNNILRGRSPDFKYKIENEDHYLLGKLNSDEKKSSDSDSFVLLSSPGKIAGFQYAKTDKEGNFSFKIPITEKINDLIIQPDAGTTHQSISIESAFSDRYTNPGIEDRQSDKIIPEYISNYSVNHQVNKIYGISFVGDPVSHTFSQPKLKRFYGKPDYELIMKDYITLPVMQEVFFELLTGVLLKEKKGGYRIRINDPLNNMPYENEPGMFVDGVVVKDASVIAAIEPELVEKIDVIRAQYYVGDYFFSGIVNVITKAGDFSNAAVPIYAVRIPYLVLDRVNSFLSPDYSSEDKKTNRIPDFRNTLYWNPSVKPDKAGKAKIGFWSSDLATTYEVNIQGIDSGGNIISLKKHIKVK
jgi:hypothetical protein